MPVDALARLLDPYMRRILQSSEDPHDVVGDLLARLTTPPLFTEVDGVGALCVMWAELTDIVDGYPVSYGPESDAIALREFARAAREWLAMSPTPAGLAAYIASRTTRLSTLEEAVRELMRVADCFVSGNGRSEDLPRFAADLLARDLDSPALRELAGLSRSDVRAAADLFIQVMDEFGYPAQRTGAAAANAREAAHALLERRAAPPNAAAEIADHLNDVAAIENRADYAALAAHFMALADAWHSNPSERATIVAEIKATAHEFLDRG